MGQVSLQVNGRRHEIACADGEESRLLELGAFIDEKVSELRANVGLIPETKLMLMACLLIADDLFTSRENPDVSAAPAPNSDIMAEIQAEADTEKLAMADHIQSIAERMESIAARLEHP